MSNIHQPHPILEKGQIIPAFTLPGTDGMPHSPWDYKQRDHLLLLFLHSSTTNETCALLSLYSQHYAEFRAEHCAILAITPDPVLANLQAQEKLRLPFPLVSDVQGDAISRYTRWNADTHTLVPRILLADRYNVLYEQNGAEDVSMLPALEETLASLNYLNLLCTP